jgi:uncharacterized membrane protein
LRFSQKVPTVYRYTLTMNPFALNSRTKLNLLLLASTLFCAAMVFVRVYFSGTLSYTFLFWNLFLGFIPFVISTFLSRIKTPATVFYPLTFLWLLFFPNAPYVLTDLIHLRQHVVPLWYDLLLLLSFAWTSLMFGFVSLADMQRLIQQRFNTGVGWLFAVSALALGSFGIYLGRFLRWNSWDVITEPRQLAWDILERVANPLAYTHIFGFTILLAAFLLLAYLTLQFFGPNEKMRLES